MRKVDPALIEAAQTLGARGWQLVRRVIIPASITDIYTDMRILLGWAWTYLIVAEVVGTMSGITFFINQQARYRNFDNVYAAIGMIGIIGFTTDMLLAWLGTVLFPWKRRARSRQSRTGRLRKAVSRCRTGRSRAASATAGLLSANPTAMSIVTLDFPITASRRPKSPRVSSAFASGPSSSACSDLRKDVRQRRRHRTSPSTTSRSTFTGANSSASSALPAAANPRLIRIVAGLDEATRRRNAARRQAGDRARARIAAWSSKATRSSRGAR